MKNLIQSIKQFCDERDWEQFHGPKDLGIGLVTEASELLDLFRYKSEDEIRLKLSEPTFKEKVSDELADVFFFLLRFSDLNGVNLEQALKNKLVKNAKKYPVEKSKGSNKKYNEF